MDAGPHTAWPDPRGGGGAAGARSPRLGGLRRDDGQAKPAAGGQRKTAPAGAMNVVVVVIDSLRADHIYGRRARTDAFDALAGDGLRFTRAFPEGMPTIPARRSIMEGHRVYPVPRLAAVQGAARPARAGSRSGTAGGCGPSTSRSRAGPPGT